MSSIDIMNKFMEKIKNACGDKKCIDENFMFLNDEIKKGNARIGKKDVKDIITTFYKETSKFPELNKFWSNYTNILQYNNKEVRRILVCNLVQRDVENGIPCPYRVLEIVFQDRELVKLINSPQTYIQAALQVKDLSPNHLNLLGGDSVGGRIFRKELENLFMHKWKTLLCSKNAEGNLKAIEDVFEYIKIIRKNLNKVANEDIIANFNNFGKVCCNLNIYTCASSTTKELSNHNKVMEKPSFLNYEKLLKDYSRGMVRKEILYELLYEIYIYENKREELLSYLKSRYNNIYYIFKDLKYKSVCETGFIPDQITRICMSRGYPSTIIKPQFQTEYYSLEKSKLFIECDPNTCVKNCDKKSHTKWFKINFVEGSELSLNVVEELKDLAKNGQNQTLFLDVKCTTKNFKKYILYINIFIPKYKFISFNLDKINNYQTMKTVVSTLFLTNEFKIFCYNRKSLREKFMNMFSDVFEIGGSIKFGNATVICLINRLCTLVEAGGNKCSIPLYFPTTWRKAYQCKNFSYNNESDDDEEITKWQRKQI